MRLVIESNILQITNLKGSKNCIFTNDNLYNKKLAKGKRYYVKVCPYTVYNDGTYVFGQNSYVKQVFIKK